MSSPVVVGLGEVLFDIVENSEELGGAPANFAYHAKRLGAEAYIISTVGNDERGKKALRQLQDRNLTTEYITVRDGFETGYVRAEIDNEGIATYVFPDNIAWDNIELNERALQLAGKADGVCFGTLAQRSEVSQKAIYKVLESVSPKTIKVCDVNLRQDFYTKEIIQKSLEYADILKLNDDELPIVAEFFQLSGSPLKTLTSLLERFSLKLAVLTRGGSGSLLVSAKDSSDHPGVQVTSLQDTIGAGDAFTASVLISMLAGEDLNTINSKANEIAALVCSHRGAMPLL